MEILKFHFENGTKPLKSKLKKPELIGVVSSGNLEILIEPANLKGCFEIEIQTPIKGFNAIWKAVVEDFYERWNLCDVRFTINDMGATPGVVVLRLNQALDIALKGEL